MSELTAFWVKDKYLIPDEGEETERKLLMDRTLGKHVSESYWKVVKRDDVSAQRQRIAQLEAEVARLKGTGATP